MLRISSTKAVTLYPHIKCYTSMLMTRFVPSNQNTSIMILVYTHVFYFLSIGDEHEIFASIFIASLLTLLSSASHTCDMMDGPVIQEIKYW